MNPIKKVIKDLNDVLDALAQVPPVDRQTLHDLLFKAQTDLVKATKTIVGTGEDGNRT